MTTKFDLNKNYLKCLPIHMVNQVKTKVYSFRQKCNVQLRLFQSGPSRTLAHSGSFSARGLASFLYYQHLLSHNLVSIHSRYLQDLHPLGKEIIKKTDPNLILTGNIRVVISFTRILKIIGCLRSKSTGISITRNKIE